MMKPSSVLPAPSSCSTGRRPPFARAAHDRRANLLASIDELQPRIELAQKEYEDAKAALDKLLASQGAARQRQAEPRLRRGKYARASFSRGQGAVASRLT